MTRDADNQTTELLRNLLDERGIEYAESQDRFRTRFRFNYCEACGDYLNEIEVMGACITASKSYLTPEQAIAAAVGSGVLTAEQVREAVMSADRWEKPMGNTGLTNTHLIVRDDGWQAIADELNAELGNGTCELAYGEDDEGYDGWYCQSCGGWFDAARRDGKLVEPMRCGCCGRKVKR